MWKWRAIYRLQYPERLRDLIKFKENKGLLWLHSRYCERSLIHCKEFCCQFKFLLYGNYNHCRTDGQMRLNSLYQEYIYASGCWPRISRNLIYIDQHQSETGKHENSCSEQRKFLPFILLIPFPQMSALLLPRSTNWTNSWGRSTNNVEVVKGQSLTKRPFP